MIKRTLYVTTPCRLFTQNEQLVFRYSHIKGSEELPDKSVPIEDIAYLVLEHPQTTLTQPVLNKLIENNVAIITCNAKMHPTGLMLNLDGNSVQSERFRAQVEASEPLKKQLWQQTIVSKISNQAALLKKYDNEYLLLEKLSKRVKSGDKTNCEGQAAVFYWQRLFSEKFFFFRKREGLPPNNLLNYGYAILRAATARSLVGSGLLPTLGIFHRNRYNAYCLADDIMEPYRPFLDNMVLEMIHEFENVEELTTHMKKQMLTLLTIDVEIEGRKSPLMVALTRTTASLANCYLGNQRKIVYPSLI